MPNILNNIVCPHCGTRGKVKQYLIETIRREAIVTELYEHGVEGIDETSVVTEPVDDYVPETFHCAVCRCYLGTLSDVIQLAAAEPCEQ